MARVICLDDDDSVAKLVAKVVEFCGHEAVVEVDSVVAASTHVRDQRVKAILADYMMPKMDGLEVLTVFRDARPDVRRVLITAAPNEPEVKKAAQEGLVQMVIAKPPGIVDVQMALAWLNP